MAIYPAVMVHFEDKLCDALWCWLWQFGLTLAACTITRLFSSYKSPVNAKCSPVQSIGIKQQNPENMIW